MQTKLTLRMDEALIRKAKRHSRKTGKSLSRLVADYFELIGREQESTEVEITPRVRALHGALSGANLSEEDYRRYLEARQR